MINLLKDLRETQDFALLDRHFLAALSEQKEREIFARITALDINELPIDYIEGRVTGGSINLDGASAVRRTCSLTMITDQVDINDFYWGIKTKFKLEIGLRNGLIGEYAAVEDGLYPEIVWFLQGTFIVSSFNTSISTNNCTISLQGKDKMCLLNGEFGGQLFASIDFGTEETEVQNMVKKTITAASSDVITTNRYYRKIEIDEKSENIIYASNPLYMFSLNNDTPIVGSYCYYKSGNQYILHILQENEPAAIKNNRYDAFKLVTSPIELFIPIGTFSRTPPYVIDYGDGPVYTYEKDTFYYEKTNGSKYFVLDNYSTPLFDKTHYKLADLYEPEFTYNIVQIPLEKIIRESVHAYAKEPYHNIIINDLDDYGLEQLTYKGDVPLYALRDIETNHFSQLILGTPGNPLEQCLSESITFDNLSDELAGVGGATLIYLVDVGGGVTAYTTSAEGKIVKKRYTVAKIIYGDDIGYRITDLTYPGDLISSIGDSLTTILDKIKAMLGDFEYFYDTQSHFVFQRKQTFVNSAWSQITDSGDESYVDYSNSELNQKFSFNFEGNRLITAIQNAPVLNNLKNDFVVWGKRKGISGEEIPIHARYAIDKKPVYYKALDDKIYAVDYSYVNNQQDSEHKFIVKDSVLQEILNFTPHHALPNYLTAPTKNKDGSWNPGWWDIRDWRDFYYLLTGKEPNGTMKFYSTGDETGCISARSLGGSFAHYQSKYQVWLIEVYKNGNINTGHGFGQYGLNKRECQLYTSNYDNDTGRIIYTRTNQVKSFFAPYSQCSDTHTYLYFLDRIQNGETEGVYFYNPAFPDATYEELLEERLGEEYLNWLEDNQIYIVDWREIIYQMALDYFAGQGCSVDEPIYLHRYEANGTDAEGKPILKEYGYELNDPDHFLYEVGQRNPYYYPTGYTGYEQYYTDLEGFWRQLYNPTYMPKEIYTAGYYENKKKQDEGTTYYRLTKAWTEQSLTDYDIEYYVNKEDKKIKKQFEQLVTLRQIALVWVQALCDKLHLPRPEDPLGQYEEQQQNEVTFSEARSQLVGKPEDELNALYKSWTTRKENLDQLWLKYQKSMITPNAAREKRSWLITSLDEAISRTKYLHWNKAVFEDPESLNFWFDFLDSGTELTQFSVPMVGSRSKVINEDKAGAIVYKSIPDLILYDTFTTDGQPNITHLREQIEDLSGYTFIYLPKGFSQYFSISYRGLSIKNKIDELLYQYAYCIENITLTAIPVYYLEPNTRIYVQDKSTNINGEYIVSKITLPLSYNGTMSITATKAPERLL